jgi:hypothetical protein
MTTEQTIQNRILQAVSRGAARLFRCNTGQGWAGRAQRISRADHVLVQPGDVIVRDARPLHAGLTVGGADLIGWRTVEVTADMVGQRLAVFTAVEVKSARGRVSPAQRQFLDAVLQAGGRAGVAHCEDEAREIVDGVVFTCGER